MKIPGWRTPLLVLTGMLVFGTWAPVALATDPLRTLAQLQHTALRAEDGAPAGASSMAQTEDGWLWLSTRSGLYRYDGFTFERVPLLPAMSNDTSATWSLYAAPGGDLWVSLANGGLARVRGDKVELYGETMGLPRNRPIVSIHTDGEGTVWCRNEDTLFRFDGHRWHRVGTDWGVAGPLRQLFEDGRGNLWLQTDKSVLLLRRHGRRFEAVDVPLVAGAVFLLGPQGRIMQRSETDVRALPGAWGQPFPLPPRTRANSTPTLFDRDGNLWTIECRSDLCRGTWQDVERDGSHGLDTTATQTFGEAQGMSSSATMNLMEDRDGHVWVSTKVGLDRFRDSWLARVRFPATEAYFALVEDGNGQIWSGTSAHSAHQDKLWHLTPEPVALPGFHGEVDSTWRDTDGSVWLGGAGQLWHMRDRQPEPVALPKDALERKALVQAIARDGAGRLWISLRLAGVFVQSDEGWWLPAPLIAPFPDDAPAVIHVDPQGRPWFGYLDGTVGVLDGPTLTRYGAAQGLGLGPVTAINTIDGRLVVASEHALSFFDHGRFRRLIGERPGLFDSITGIVQSKDGEVWAYGTSGVARFSREAWRRALSDPTVAVPGEPLTMEEGLAGPAQLVRPLPTAAVAGDGRVWFAGSQGLAWLDPARQPRLPPAPPVVVRTIASGGKTFHPNDVVTLGDSRDLDVSYTALAAGYPNGVVFRYRLVGEDDGWHDAGQRREATYPSLEPGRYSFQVQASYDRQQWSRSTPVDVDVPPRFTESRLFKFLAVTIAAVLIWFVHRWRVRTLTGRLRMRLNERHGERERIARELHDTFLQGAQGLVLRFQALVDRLPANDASREALERAIDRAEHLLVEGRDRVQGLRTGLTAGPELDDRLDMLVRDMDQGILLRITGERHHVNSVVQDEVYSIVREALTNALRHSGARAITVSMTYARRALRIDIRDDGIGFTPGGTMLPDTRHYGVQGMRERAAHIGARLAVLTAPRRGTEIHLTIPARSAYLRRAADKDIADRID